MPFTSIGRLNGTFRDRPNAIRCIGKVTSVMVRRHTVRYNFSHAHMGPDGNTPGDRAGTAIGDDKLLMVIQNAARHAGKAGGPPGARGWTSAGAPVPLSGLGRFAGSG